MQTELADGAKGRYKADGFWLSPEPIIPADVVTRAVEGMDAIRRGESETGRSTCGGTWRPGDDPNKLCKIEQPQFASRAVMELVSHPALGRAAAVITGASMVQAWWVQLLYKPSTVPDDDSNTSIGLHQDRHYWGEWEEGSELFTAWVALSDVREDCGPMKFVRGSHQWGHLEGLNFFEQDVDAQREFLQKSGQEWEEVTALLPPGGASFHHNLTIHGSGLNYSGHPRRSFAIHLRTQNSRPVGGKREGLTSYIDNTELCPVIYGKL